MNENSEQKIKENINILDNMSGNKNISELARSEAYAFLKSFPFNGVVPEVTDDGFNGISFEYLNDKGEEFVVTFKGIGEYIYSGIFESGAIYGSEKISGVSPKNLLGIIEQNF